MHSNSNVGDLKVYDGTVVLDSRVQDMFLHIAVEVLPSFHSMIPIAADPLDEVFLRAYAPGTEARSQLCPSLP